MSAPNFHVISDADRIAIRTHLTHGRVEEALRLALEVYRDSPQYDAIWGLQVTFNGAVSSRTWDSIERPNVVKPLLEVLGG